jgi:hypothetical protein
LLTSVGKNILFENLNPSKDSYKFWITDKTRVVEKSNLIGVFGAKHKIKEEEK